MLEIKEHINNIWILERDTSVCIFEYNLVQYKYDADLIGGFISAIFSFGNELVKDQIQSIQFKEFTLSVKLIDKIFLIVSFKNSAPIKRINQFINKISNKFIEDFGDALKNFCGNIEVFSEFLQYLDKILNSNHINKVFLKKKQFNKLDENIFLESDYEEFKIMNLFNRIDVEDDYLEFDKLKVESTDENLENKELFRSSKQPLIKISENFEDFFRKIGKNAFKDISEADYKELY
ncbi:MAG: hypothetical protein ACTSRZ_17915 [Promethearchaeota archaeon]